MQGEPPEGEQGGKVPRFKWCSVKRKGSPDTTSNKRPATSGPIAVTNFYAPLSDEDEDITDRDLLNQPSTSAPTPTTSTPMSKPVDVVFPPVDDVNEFLREINTVIGRESYTYTTQRDGKIRISSDKVDT